MVAFLALVRIGAVRYHRHINYLGTPVPVIGVFYTGLAQIDTSPVGNGRYPQEDAGGSAPHPA